MNADPTSVAPNSPGRDPFLLRLKAETRAEHERTEQAVDLLRRLQSLSEYQDLLARFYGLYQPLEKAMRAAATFPDSSRDRLMKTELLERDLAALGMSSQELAALPICLELPSLNSPAACFGCLYVLEGATLGGQIVRRVVEQRFPQEGESICHFFNPYDSQTGKMWTDFCSLVATFVSCHRDTETQLISSAKETFACFELWLQKKAP